MPPDQNPATLSGSPQRDRICILFLVFILIFVSPRLRVYYKIAAARVEATLITPDGQRAPLVIPRQLQKAGTINYTMQEQLSIIDKNIKIFMEQVQPLAGTLPGTRLEWDIRYSFNDPKLDKKKTLSFVR